MYLTSKLSKHKDLILKLLGSAIQNWPSGGAKPLSPHKLERTLGHLGLTSLTDRGDPDWKNSQVQEGQIPESLWKLFHARYIDDRGSFDPEKFAKDLKSGQKGLQLEDPPRSARVYLDKSLRGGSVSTEQPNKGSLFTPNRVEETFPRVQRRIRRHKIDYQFFETKPVWTLQEVVDRFKPLGIAQRDLECLLTVKNGLVQTNELQSLLKEENPGQVIDRIQRRNRLYLTQNQAQLGIDKIDTSGAQHVSSSVDQEGRISMIKEETALKRLLDTIRSKAKGNLRTFRSIDNDGDGFITEQDFNTICALTHQESRISPAALFSLLDKDGKGFISIQDITRFQHHHSTGTSLSLPCKESHQHTAALLDRSRTARPAVEITDKNTLINQLNKPTRTTRTSAHPAYLLQDTFASTMGRFETGPNTSAHAPTRIPSNSAELAAERTGFQREDRFRKEERLAAN